MLFVEILVFPVDLSFLIAHTTTVTVGRIGWWKFEKDIAVGCARQKEPKARNISRK